MITKVDRSTDIKYKVYDYIGNCIICDTLAKAQKTLVNMTKDEPKGSIIKVTDEITTIHTEEVIQM